MNKLLALEDLKDKSEDEIKLHLATEYGSESYYHDGNKDEDVFKRLKQLKILIAYESVGSWGCDSSSFFLFQEKKTGKLFELHGSHCSCYGFEEQFKLEETTAEALAARNEGENNVFYTGGYDGAEEDNYSQVKEYIKKLSSKLAKT